ncbi:xanthine dehydrogenase family protein molybdopterin-binding subunit [Iningainema tapete]|uniref:Xanthine dehydrogenase family protein molybdopterin-binding subunit n=1 Tax=Iningainema tapete BLCC-T55 TaxID=2748662 RepID=A0A8J7BXE1_9CYAN|nr:xanthine dehydrogenase family protein molybdopterin-binding subunit [Iningainema tapete]MBD2772743.1 xanthine dehydrogenase family protein molybdopterin-binding subunit [Iningainema tapete BLCC-T55]
MTNVVGKEIVRADALLKVTGAARYSAEIPIAKMAYAVFVGSKIAKGKILKIETKAAESAGGVLMVLTHENAMRIKKPADIFDPGKKVEKPTNTATSVLPLQSNEIFFRGQAIAAVVAETYEQARYAAALVKIEYIEDPPAVDFLKNIKNAVVPESLWGEPPTTIEGDPENALKTAAIKIDEIYHTPLENHHAMEMQSTSAEWRGDELVVYDTTRFVQGVKRMLAQSFDLVEEKVRVRAEFVGGAFGSKGMVRPHVALVAMCAKQVNRPVKLVLTRRQMTETSGHRPETRQRVALGAGKDGKLTAIIHEGESSCSATDPFVEPFTIQTHGLYAAPHRKLAQRIVYLNVAQPAPMRAPGEASGMFALESAMDELAFKLKIDPLELRRINEPAKEPVTNKEFSCRRLIQCIDKGAEAFGWSKRNVQAEARREGNNLIGYGFAASVYPLKGNPTEASCRIYADGRVVVQSSTHDFGNGISTSARQIAADALGVGYEKIKFEYADSSLPPAPMTGGSTATMWVGTAIKKACEQAKAQVAALAGNENAADYATVLKKSNRKFVEARAEAKPDAEKKKKYAMDSYGAHFCEVAVDAVIGTVTVRRFTSVYNCGRIINPKLAHSQFVSSIVWGIGMALMEYNLLDARNGKWIHADLNDYHVPTFADITRIEALWLDEPDEIANPLGAKGVGEIGIVGAAAAIANAVFNATGKRIRDLPITPDQLL